MSLIKKLIEKEIITKEQGDSLTKEIETTRQKEEKLRADDLETGLKNKHYKKFEREELIEEYELVCMRKHQLERKAGFFDKKNNIFARED